MARPRGSKGVTEEEQNKIAQWLLQRSSDGKVQYGAKQAAADHFHLSVKTIWAIWKKAAAQQLQGLPIHVKPMKGSVHKDRKIFDEDKVKNLSVLQRSSLRVMAENIGVSKSQIHNWVKDHKLKAHTNAIKPFLTDENKLCRLRWSLSQLESIIEGGTVKFQTMFNTIHVDEKWFYLSKAKDRYYLTADEIEPYRACKSKRYIPKIMFDCAVSRPIIDGQGNVIFDGKFGIFPFTSKEPAKRNSKNREKGTLETKPINAITRSVMKDKLLQEMVPAIKAKWPDCLGKHIYIQQDNAKPHILDSDPDFQAIAHTDGFHIHLIQQPANSPDTNVNDLGFFRSIQSLKDQKQANTVDDLLQNIKEAYDNYPPEKLNHVFLTLQNCYKEIMRVKGGNNYRIPHMGKGRLARLGDLPECIEVDTQLVTESLEYLKANGIAEDRFYNFDELVKAMEQMVLEE